MLARLSLESADQPIYVTQATWSYPATNRLLFQAGISALHNRANPRATRFVRPDDISITELSTNYTYNSFSLINPTTGGRNIYDQTNERFSVTKRGPFEGESLGTPAGPTTQGIVQGGIDRCPP